MDRVTSSILKEWSSNAGIDAPDESVRFERFVNFIVLSRQHDQQFNADDFSCGDDGAQGIDGFALSVNGELISNSEELEDVLSGAQQIESVVTFTQAKTSSSFDLGQFSVFADTVVSMLKSDTAPHPALKDQHEMLQQLFDASSRFRVNPICRMYFVTTGNWTAPAPFISKIEDTKSRLDDTNLLSRVDIQVWGAKEIQDSWRAIDSATEATIQFEQKTTLPDMPGVDQAYIGVLPGAELVKLIVDDNDEVRKTLFFDNVRDFQGDNEVNRDIELTLESQDAQHFCVLNNGVTAVARELKVTGNRFTLRDFQIVNGCQTSHILHKHRSLLDGVYVPFRLVVSNNDDVTNSITKATNKQSQVTQENLLALAEVQRRIEAYFNAFTNDDKHRIYYERRSKQWSGSPQVRGTWRIITLRNLMQSFASMYLRIPHTAARYYGDLRTRAGAEIFNEAHHPAYYYSAAYAFCRLDQYFGSDLDRRFKPVRYHILAGVRALYTESQMPEQILSNEKRAEAVCTPFNKFLWSDAEFTKAVEKCTATLDELAQGAAIDRDFGRNQEFSDLYFRMLLGTEPS